MDANRLLQHHSTSSPLGKPLLYVAIVSLDSGFEEDYWVHICTGVWYKILMSVNLKISSFAGKLTTVEPPKTDSPYCGNLRNEDKSPRSRIIRHTICTFLPPYSGNICTPNYGHLHAYRTEDRGTTLPPETDSGRSKQC